MSSMIKCDKCGAMFYQDSRSDKGDYCTMWIEDTQGSSVYHLCRRCHKELLVNFMKTLTPSEYDEVYEC